MTGAWNWIIPGLILLSGIYMHGRFTGRLPLVLAWLGGFATQGLVRAAVFGMPWRVPFAAYDQRRFHPVHPL